MRWYVGDTPMAVAIAGASAHQELAITSPQNATDTDAVRKYDKIVDYANLISLCAVNSNGRPMTITNSTEKMMLQPSLEFDMGL